jgi:hypothetical protein
VTSPVPETTGASPGIDTWAATSPAAYSET